jgi:hypothetical protein
MNYRATLLSAIPKLIAAAMLVWALDRHPYDYYTILRWVVCGVAVYVAWTAANIEKVGWAWTYGIMAALFNPIIPVHLSRDTWAVIDLAGAVLMVISIFTVRPEE